MTRAGRRGPGSGVDRSFRSRYVLRRLAQGIFVLWGAFTAAFVILYTLPGNPVLLMLGGNDGAEITVASQAQIAQVEQEYGFNKPVIVQYLDSLGHFLTGDFGRSIETGGPVTAMIGSSLGQTLQLALAALILAVVLGTGVAVLSVWTNVRFLRQFLLALPSVGVSMPTFWTGLLLVELFSFQLRMFPAVGNNGFRGLVLPAITLAIPTSAVIAQLLAKSLRTIMEEPYIESALARGMSRGAVLFRHALRPASIPTMTMLGVIVGNMVAGSVVVETVFSRVGIGRLAFQAVDSEDIPVIQALVVLSALIFVIVSLAVDLLYLRVDPRIALPGGRTR